MNTHTTHVYCDNVDHDGDTSLMLEVIGELDPHGWHGFAVPTTTAAEFGRYISALARNDRNSTYGQCTASVRVTAR